MAAVNAGKARVELRGGGWRVARSRRGAGGARGVRWLYKVAVEGARLEGGFFGVTGVEGGVCSDWEQALAT